MKTLIAIICGAATALAAGRGALALAVDTPTLVTIVKDKEGLPPPAVLPAGPGDGEARRSGPGTASPAGATAVEQPGRPGEARPPRALRPQATGRRQAVARRRALPAEPGPPALTSARRRAQGVVVAAPPAAPPAAAVAASLAPAAPIAPPRGARALFVPESSTPTVPSTILRAWGAERPFLR